MEEIWKEIKGYQDKYKVSDLGRIKRILKYREKLLSQQLNTSNYYQALLTINGYKKRMLVSRIVAEAFLENKENKRTVNHKDGDIHNNCLSNLEWATYSENHLHAFRVLGRKPPEHLKLVHGRQRKPVLKIDKNGNILKRYKSQMDAERDGYCQGSISNVCNGKCKRAHGYIWKFENSPN